MGTTLERPFEVDWAARWRGLVRAMSGDATSHRDISYWDRRAATFARSTRNRADELVGFISPFLSPRKTLIDVGAGAGRHAVPLAERLEWVTAVEPSEGMRAQIPPRDNMTVVASTWEDAEVARADLVICCHVLNGVEEPVPFIEKLERSARERIFVMLRESPPPHPARLLRERLLGSGDERIPRFSDLFMLLMEMSIAPDVSFMRYPVVNRYSNVDEALDDCRTMLDDGWDEARARALLEEMLVKDGDEVVYNAGVSLTGIAHWQPVKS